MAELRIPRARTAILFVGPLGLIVVRPDSVGWPLFFILGLAASHLFAREIGAVTRRPPVRRAQNALLLLVILFLAVAAPAPLLEWFLRFAVLLGLSLAFAAGEPEREWKLIVVTFLLILISAAQTEEPVFAVPLMAFVALLPAALADLEASQLPGPERHLRGAEGVTGVTLAILTLVLFFTFPRTSRTILGRGMLRPGQQAHMGETITLHSITDIKQSPRVAMRVRVDGALPPETKWRGSAFDQYDGMTWRITTPRTGMVKKRTDNQGRLKLRDAPPDAPVLRQEFQMEPGLAAVVFAARVPVTLDCKSLVQIHQREEDLLLGFAPPGLLRYTVASVPPAWLALHAPEEPQDHHRYLDIPELSPSIRELARSVTADAATTRGKLQTLERFFHTRFRYSLSVVRDADMSPIEDFLLRQREGHCEFFASGMVLMARSLGIPARLVDGFMQGEYSELSGTYVVRRSDAHAWVEAHIESEGWVTFDPTPEAPPLTGISAVTSWLRETSVRLWTRLVADYSVVEQRALIAAAAVAVRRLIQVPALVPVLAGVPIALFIIRRARRLRKGEGRGPTARSPWTRALDRAVDTLAPLGVSRGPSDTPRELLARAQARGALPSFDLLVHLHEASAYASTSAPWDGGAARVLLGQLRDEVNAVVRRTPTRAR